MYSPKVKEELIPQLYQLKLIAKKPMTTLVNEAIIEYLNLRKEIFTNEQQTQSNPGSSKDRDQSSRKNYQSA
jgi:predicted GNAT family N-acyltransferase